MSNKIKRFIAKELTKMFSKFIYKSLGVKKSRKRKTLFQKILRELI